jgi:6-pyruvoyltetrahydropterin/6-carboxytetrahydropterin synthase
MPSESLNEHYRAHIRKEALKFAAAHMTVFPDGTKEALHGHNYRTEVSIDLKSVELSQMISFSVFKSAMKEICQEWDEKVLIAAKCPFMEVFSTVAHEVEFKLCGKRYVLPKDEVVFIERDNITSETLAAEFCSRFIACLDPKILGNPILAVQVRVEEMSGQGASYFWEAK